MTPDSLAAAVTDERAAAPAPARALSSTRVRLRLATLSFLMLFVELALIRWTAANNINLAYLTNFILFASFLGIGIGFLRAERPPDLFRWAPVFLALLVAFVLAFPVELTTLSGSHRLQGAFGLAPLPRWLSLSAVFALSAVTMAAIGQGVAQVFVRFRPLEAYRLDVLGSIAGIVAFTLISFLWLPPIAWGAVAAVLMAVLIGRRPQLLALLVVLVLLGIESASSNVTWSPYYKITAVFTKATRVNGVRTHDVLAISANNIPHQTVYPLATLRRLEPFYFFPYRHVDRRSLHDVLIVGAGSGNDVAVALSEGAQRIDAVEIDPVIQNLGARYHPDHPYQSPRVHVTITDGRAYIERTHRRYDLILFALPDSLTLLGGQGNLRLENYLFTLESMERVRALLVPGGTFAMYNYYEPWLLDRYASTLKQVFGQPPCVELGASLAARRQAVLTAGAGAAVRCARRWHGAAVSPPTDDWPFPYLQTKAIPTYYLEVLGLVLAASLVSVFLAGGRLRIFRTMGSYLDLGLMGAAFMLLESKNVVQFALLFGTTWLVNALVFAGVLLAVYLAVETAQHVPLPPAPVLYALLLGSLALTWAVPQDALLTLDPVARFFAATALAFAPIYLANLVFARRFRDTSAVTAAFAVNLLGAMVGGMLEYLALATGYRFLLVVVAALYGLAFLTFGATTRLARVR